MISYNIYNDKAIASSPRGQAMAALLAAAVPDVDPRPSPRYCGLWGCSALANLWGRLWARL